MGVLIAKIKSYYYKELALAVIIFLLPSIILVHKLFSQEESITTFKIIDLNFISAYSDNQSLVWSILLIILPLCYSILMFFNTSRYYRFILLPLIWWLFFELFGEIIWQIKELNKQWMFCSAICSSIVVLFLLTFDIRNARSIPIRSSNNSNFRKTKFLPFMILTLATVVIYRFTPKNELVTEFFGFDISNHILVNLRFTVWISGLKFCLMAILLAWFFLEKKWWKYALLSPILITSYQIRNLFDITRDTVDEYEIFHALPLLTLIALVLIALSKNAKDEYVVKTIYKSTSFLLETKLMYKKRERVASIEKAKNQLGILKSKESSGDLETLHDLKAKLEDQLGKK